MCSFCVSESRTSALINSTLRMGLRIIYELVHRFLCKIEVIQVRVEVESRVYKVVFAYFTSHKIAVSKCYCEHYLLIVLCYNDF